jgi:hypothetical protein
MKGQRSTLLKAFLTVLVFAAVAAPAAVGSDLRSPDTQDAAKAGQWGRVSDMLLPDTQDAAKAGQWGRVSDMLLPDTQDAAKASQPASDINMQSPDTQDAAKAGQWGRVSDMLLPDTQDAANGRRGAGPTIEVVTVAAPSGFDWVDSGIGAAFVLGLSLIGAGALLVAQRRRRDSALTV